jgi:hypothetical protein
MRHGAQLRHEVAVVQRYLASLRNLDRHRSGARFARRAPAPTAAPAAGANAEAAEGERRGGRLPRAQRHMSPGRPG